MKALARDGAEHPDHYYYERAAPFSVSSTCICKALKRLGVTYKKSLQHPKAHPEVRTAFQEKLRKYQNEGRPVVCIDENGFAQDMPRKHGHAKRGKRYFSRHAWGERGGINVIGALLGATLLTVSLFQGTINGDVFEAWVEGDLLPKLPPKSVIVMDNAAFHKTQRLEKLFEQTDHSLLYLPPYSPNMNPIENKWAQAKSIRRTQQCSVSELFQNNKI